MTTVLGASSAFSPVVQAIMGDSSPIRRLRALIATVARTRLAVLIQGPTGSGKELVAAALHTESGRCGAFVPFNVCAISESMFEDALFGHVRGAFTGAFNDVPGFLREANGGTVFLDEVGGLAPTLQAKLLRAMETGVFRPVGAKRDTQSDFRVVAATNERLDQLMDGGRFRADFAHRVGAVTLDVPSLLDRLEDIPLLVRHFLERVGSGHIRVDAAALDVLASHEWPGNVRELKNVVEWAAAFSNGHLGADVLRSALAQRMPFANARRGDADALERHMLRQALEHHEWNTERAAQQLGVHRATLYRRMKRLGLAVPLRLAE
jgi:DNA-binding NtrC family response regulator